ncbi:hypothetical protein ACWDE0_16090 [Streptomyces sp. 900105755]
MPQAAIETPLFVGIPEAQVITPLGSLEVDRGMTDVTPEGVNSKPFLAIIHNVI